MKQGDVIGSEQLQYPVLCGAHSKGIFVVNDISGLNHARPSVFWKAKLYDGLWIVESTGRQYDVRNPKVSRQVTGIGLWWAKIFDLPVDVTFELRETVKTSLPQLVRRIKALMSQDEQLFEELSGKSVTTWSNDLDGCKSIQEVILLFGA